jgi:hypothetical protein
MQFVYSCSNTYCDPVILYPQVIVFDGTVLPPPHPSVLKEESHGLPI